MFAPLRAATVPAWTTHARPGRAIVGLAMAAALLGGCTPQTVSLARDPADPGAAVPRVAYRSGIAPYTGLRPSAPASWTDRNNAVTPRPGSDR